METRSRLSSTNENGLTFREWLAASGHPDSRKARRAWRSGEDPTDWMASLPRTPPPPVEKVSSYEYRRRGTVPDTVKVGDYLHDTRGSWELWRVERVFGADFPYVSCVRVTGSKFSRPGDRRELLDKRSHVLEEDPHGFILHFGLPSEIDTLVASFDIDHNEIDGRRPIWRTHHLHEVVTTGRRGDRGAVERRWYVTIDGTSRTWLSEQKAASLLSECAARSADAGRLPASLARSDGPERAGVRGRPAYRRPWART